MKAVVMAGGEGTRLRPLTVERPKPMVPIANRPVLEHVLALLRRHDVTEVIITLQYMASVIQDYFGDGGDFGVKIHYSVEDVPLGTAGSVKAVESLLDEPFLVISGDALTDIDLTAAVDFHHQRKALATLVLSRVSNPLEYGVVITDDEGRIRQFLEKPSWGEVFSDTVNTGIYVLDPRVLAEIPAGQSVDFSREVFPALLNEKGRLLGHIADGYWCDVGSLADYMRASADALHGRVRIERPEASQSDGVLLAGDAQIAEDVRIYGPVLVGRDCRLASGVTIYGPSVIGDYCVLDARATVDRSVVWSNCYLGEGATLQGAIVCKQCSVKRRSIVFEGAVIGDRCTINEGAIVRADVRVWPGKEIEAGATVSTSLIWGARGRRSLFGRSGIGGLANVEITPEFAAKVGAAYGATLPRGAAVTINRDLSRAARMIKRALISGLPSAGINVVDIEAVPLPVARFETASSGARGGIHVRLSPVDAQGVDIKLFDARGVNLDRNTERKIENIFFREDFRRVPLDEIGAIIDAVGVAERYTDAFLRQVNAEAVERAHFKIVLDFAEGTASQVFSSILERLEVPRVSLNAATGERHRVRTAQELRNDLRQLALITTTVRANLGVVMNNDGTRIVLVDERGNVVPEFSALAAAALLAVRARGGGTVIVPAHAPRMLDELVGRHGGQVVRTRGSSQALMIAAARKGVVLAGDDRGGFVFPEFPSGFDCMIAIVKLLEFLATQGVWLSEVVSGLPPYYLTALDVPCPWDLKGRVMRALNERVGGTPTPSVDGVQFELGEEWVIISPDPDRPAFHIIAESRSDEHAQALAGRYVDLIRAFQS
ncbi:MAG: mannose-1-phosphate guanyltransferase [Chloroflexi bacterium]|nr:mannose-1-phosphate guanyltransferase [Chloroflexota bacterium]